MSSSITSGSPGPSNSPDTGLPAKRANRALKKLIVDLPKVDPGNLPGGVGDMPHDEAAKPDKVGFKPDAYKTNPNTGG